MVADKRDKSAQMLAPRMGCCHQRASSKTTGLCSQLFSKTFLPNIGKMSATNLQSIMFAMIVLIYSASALAAEPERRQSAELDPTIAAQTNNGSIQTNEESEMGAPIRLPSSEATTAESSATFLRSLLNSKPGKYRCSGNNFCFR